MWILVDTTTLSRPSRSSSRLILWHASLFPSRSRFYMTFAVLAVVVYEERHRWYYWRLSFPPHSRYSLEMRTNLFLAIDVGWRDSHLTFFLHLDVSSKVWVVFRYGKPTSLIVSMFCTHPDRSITLGIRWSQDLVCLSVYKDHEDSGPSPLFCIVVFPSTHVLTSFEARRKQPWTSRPS